MPFTKGQRLNWKHATTSLIIASIFLSFTLFSLSTIDGGCPHEGPDHRMFGRAGCWLQRKLTIERAESPSKIWALDLAKISMRIDPRHPHLLIEWPTRSGKLWRFRAGYRWDANARAYIFPAIAFKKVEGPMQEYQSRRTAPPRQNR